MTLHRDTPPDTATAHDCGDFTLGDDDGRWFSGNGSFDDLFNAIEEAAARLWGRNHAAAFERLFDLSEGALRTWRRQGTVPPPRIVAWLAYLASQDKPRALGMVLDGLARGADLDTALAAIRGARAR